MNEMVATALFLCRGFFLAFLRRAEKPRTEKRGPRYFRTRPGRVAQTSLCDVCDFRSPGNKVADAFDVELIDYH
jgi:hypothetical protein